MKVEQPSVFPENASGRLAEVADTLGPGPRVVDHRRL
jgi:hypothetical protein